MIFTFISRVSCRNEMYMCQQDTRSESENNKAPPTDSKEDRDKVSVLARAGAHSCLLVVSSRDSWQA